MARQPTNLGLSSSASHQRDDRENVKRGPERENGKLEVCEKAYRYDASTRKAWPSPVARIQERSRSAGQEDVLGWQAAVLPRLGTPKLVRAAGCARILGLSCRTSQMRIERAKDVEQEARRRRRLVQMG